MSVADIAAGVESDVSGGETGAESQDVHIKVNSDNWTVGRVALGTGAVLAVLLLSFMAYKALNILLLLFLALLIATAIEPLVDKLRRGPFTRTTGTLVVYGGIFTLLGVIAYILISVFFSQLGDFTTSLAKTLQDMKSGFAGKHDFFSQQATLLLNAAGSIVPQASQAQAGTPTAAETQGTVEAVTGTAVTLAEIFFGAVTIFVVAFYWLNEHTLVKRGLMTWLPTHQANRMHHIWDNIEEKVGGWVRGQLTLMAIVGAVSAVGYFALGIKFWPALALFITIAEAIPLIGPYIGTAPALLVALTQSGNDGLPLLLGMGDIGPLPRVLLVVAFAVVLQTIEGNVLVPRIMKNSVGISPLTVIIGILLGSTLAGLAGALVAVPLIGAIQVILQDIREVKVKEEKAQSAAEAAGQISDGAGTVVTVSQPASEAATAVEVKSQA